MDKNLEITKRYADLSDSAQAVLRACSILCNEGVSMRHIFDVMGGDSHSFRNELNEILRSGLLLETQHIIFAPTEVADALCEIKLTTGDINLIITKLVEKTTLSVKVDMLQVRDFFAMGFNIIKYVVFVKPEIDYNQFAKVIINIVRHYEIYAKPDPSIHDRSELLCMQAIELCKEQIDNKSLLYASLLTSEAYLYVGGFWYEKANSLLEEAIGIETKSESNSQALCFTYFVKALYYEHYGDSSRCLEYAYKAWEKADDAYFAIYMAYQLALLGEFETADRWVEKVDIELLPEYSALSVYVKLINALKFIDNEALVDSNLLEAEHVIEQINYEAPIKGRLLYVKSIIEGKWGLLRESNAHYRDYATLTAQHFASTDGAMFVLAASEVHRLTSMGATTHAKYVKNEKLDPLALPHPRYALSVKLEACLAYTDYYRTLNVPLYKTYCDLGRDYAKECLPSEETLSVLEKVFGGQVPPSASGEEYLWVWEYQALQNMLQNREISRKEIQTEIERLKERFGSHELELECIRASLLDANDAINALHSIIMRSEKCEKYDVSLLCARIAVSLGLIWDARTFFHIALNTKQYQELNRYAKIDILLEFANNLEQCGSRDIAKLIWIQLEALARGTSKLVDVWQARGNSCYDAGQYGDALEFYDKCLSMAVPEDDLFDQRLSSLWAYKSSCYGALGKYDLAYNASVEAKQYFPLDSDAFNLEYNHGFFALCLRRYKESREVFNRAKKIARNEEEKKCVDENLAILAMKTDEREPT